MKNIPYGVHERQKPDLYLPDKTNENFPVVVFFYGSSWKNGAKSQYCFVAQALAICGFITVLPDYRLYTEVTFPAFVEDGVQAMRWVSNI